jgi:hypothetical protein
MKRITAILFAALVAAGCNDDKSTKVAQTNPTATATPAATTTTAGAASEADEIKANLAKLSPEDRAAAEKQKYCVEQPDELLGSMGVPVKLTIKNETVFVCCKSCEKHALKDPDKTLAKAKELREKNSK